MKNDVEKPNIYNLLIRYSKNTFTKVAKGEKKSSKSRNSINLLAYFSSKKKSLGKGWAGCWSLFCPLGTGCLGSNFRSCRQKAHFLPGRALCFCALGWVNVLSPAGTPSTGVTISASALRKYTKDEATLDTGDQALVSYRMTVVPNCRFHWGL